MRKCKKCGEEKEDHNFYRTTGGYLRHTCICCVNKRSSLSQKSGFYRNRDLQFKYGINEVQYELLLKSQENKCMICGATKPGRKTNKHFLVDHNHKTNKVRGLLCFNCNKMLGAAKDNPEILRKAAKYLEKK